MSVGRAMGVSRAVVWIGVGGGLNAGWVSGFRRRWTGVASMRREFGWTRFLTSSRGLTLRPAQNAGFSTARNFFFFSTKKHTFRSLFFNFLTFQSLSHLFQSALFLLELRLSLCNPIHPLLHRLIILLVLLSNLPFSSNPRLTDLRFPSLNSLHNLLFALVHRRSHLSLPFSHKNAQLVLPPHHCLPNGQLDVMGRKAAGRFVILHCLLEGRDLVVFLGDQSHESLLRFLERLFPSRDLSFPDRHCRPVAFDDFKPGTRIRKKIRIVEARTCILVASATL